MYHIFFKMVIVSIFFINFSIFGCQSGGGQNGDFVVEAPPKVSTQTDKVSVRGHLQPGPCGLTRWVSGDNSAVGNNQGNNNAVNNIVTASLTPSSSSQHCTAVRFLLPYVKNSF